MARNRSSKGYGFNAKSRTWMTNNGQNLGTTWNTAYAMNVSHMTDSVNPLFPAFLGKMDVGSSLDLTQVKWRMPELKVNLIPPNPNVGLKSYHEGDVLPRFSLITPSGGLFPTAASLQTTAKSQSTLERYGLGATAISRCKPASPQAALATTVAELSRDGIPSILARLDVRNSLGIIRGAGRNYLNVEFGWKPLLRDLRKTGLALNRQADLLEDLHRNSGKRMKREYVFPEDTLYEKTTTHLGNGFAPWSLPGWAYTQDGVTVVEITTRRTWFNGEFVYYMPDASQPVSFLRAKARFLLGIDLSPETLWNATPWTWLVDWFTNMGDFMSNMSAISDDHLLMRYGYLMQETKRVNTVTHYGVRQKTPGYAALPSTISGSVEVSHKTRVGSSPYGFGLTGFDLSSRQIAIMSAIGLTRQARR